MLHSASQPPLHAPLSRPINDTRPCYSGPTTSLPPILQSGDTPCEGTTPSYCCATNWNCTFGYCSLLTSNAHPSCTDPTGVCPTWCPPDKTSCWTKCCDEMEECRSGVCVARLYSTVTVTLAATSMAWTTPVAVGAGVALASRSVAAGTIGARNDTGAAGGLTSGAEASIAFGAVAGVALLACALFWLVRRVRSQAEWVGEVKARRGMSGEEAVREEMGGVQQDAEEGGLREISLQDEVGVRGGQGVRVTMPPPTYFEGMEQRWGRKLG